MKKKMIAGVLIVGLSLATVASANWGRHGGYGNNYAGCANRQVVMNPQLDAETKIKIKQFFKDNQTLHKEIAMKRAEKRALMRNDQVDPTVAATVTGELFDLHATLMEKAEAAGVEQYVGAPMRGGHGPGFHSGRGMGSGKGKMQQ